MSLAKLHGVSLKYARFETDKLISTTLDSFVPIESKTTIPFNITVEMKEVSKFNPKWLYLELYFTRDAQTLLVTKNIKRFIKFEV